MSGSASLPAAASHELRTPLAIVRSQAELVDEPCTERAQTALPLMVTRRNGWRQPKPTLPISFEVDYMTRLIHDLLLLARDESDHRSIASTAVNLSDLVAQPFAR